MTLPRLEDSATELDAFDDALEVVWSLLQLHDDKGRCVDELDEIGKREARSTHGRWQSSPVEAADCGCLHERSGGMLGIKLGAKLGIMDEGT